MIRVVNTIPDVITVQKACNTYEMKKFRIVDIKTGAKYFCIHDINDGYMLCDEKSYQVERPLKNIISWRFFIEQLNDTGYKVYIKTEENEQ